MSSFRKSSTSCSEDDADHDQQQQQQQLRRGPWTLEEDSLLVQCITRHGEGRWNLLAKRAGLRRTGKSCRLRWLNYLKPDVKRGNLTLQEQYLILELHSKWGNRWSKIAQHLPGRTDNEIKNYWRTRVQKQARHLKIDANSTAFQNVIRCIWMPRLLQKIEGSSSFSSNMAFENSTVPQSLGQNSQFQALTSVQQVPWQQGPGNNLGEAAQSLHQQEQNSDSELSAASSCVSSSETMKNISRIPQFAENQTAPFIIGYNDYNSTLAKDCYYVDNNNSCYDMETINLASTSAVGDFANHTGSCYMADNNWVNDDFADGLWSMWEL